MTGRLRYILPVATVLLLITGCSQQAPSKFKPEPLQHGYKGIVNIAVDAGLEPIIKQQVEVFEYAYDSVDVVPLYVNEKEAIAAFKSRKTSLLILSRNLDKAERKEWEEKDTLFIRDMEVAYDAVALVGNKKYNDAQLNMAQLKSYFGNTAGSGPKLVFDDKNSSCVSEVLKALGHNAETVSENVYALHSAQEVIDYVAKEENAIGFIPFGFVSDEDDDRVKTLLDRVKILSLRVKDKDGKEIRVSANQSDIAVGLYPLRRTITAMERFTYEDNKEWRLANFMYQERGAKIFLKAGLVPAKMPNREIIVNTGPLKANP